MTGDIYRILLTPGGSDFDCLQTLPWPCRGAKRFHASQCSPSAPLQRRSMRGDDVEKGRVFFPPKKLPCWAK
ncbi:hypothetical protein I7I50_11250 [Histoplasma capsulatum G186AR]|uniref:Uncharacterized protein n=1 Tax=Ajellomyces capsulatus TaxID=5037 RepID=A0A8H7Z9E6_AJECA|nr:hypothetical protein I7I52_02488 [Histoplasma capsulatum]QSS69825.1 hypothetical protein I7I50_11250 [Histoplasma capsulatum G186AR]